MNLKIINVLTEERCECKLVSMFSAQKTNGSSFSGSLSPHRCYKVKSRENLFVSCDSETSDSLEFKFILPFLKKNLGADCRPQAQAHAGISSMSHTYG